MGKQLHGFIFANCLRQDRQQPLDCRVLTVFHRTSEEIKTVHGSCAASGDQSRALFEAWLDRSRAGWREAWGGNERQAASAQSGPMGRKEALAILGLKDGVAVQDVRAAHRRLMKEFHPDHGGSDYLAAKINEAKTVLLGGS